jgi:hypothetical protein
LENNKQAEEYLDANDELFELYLSLMDERYPHKHR